MQHRKVSAYHIIMDDDRLGIKPEVVFDMYSAMYSKARELAPEGVKNELRINRDGKIKTRFYITVSDRMAPHLLSAIQWKAESAQGMALKSYFHRLEEQVMAEMLGPRDSVTTFNISYEGKLL